MTLLNIILIGIALSMDAMAVSISNGMVYKHINKVKLLVMVSLFAIFQALMPIIGYFAGGLLPQALNTYSNIVVFFILAILGIRMIKESLCSSEDETQDTCHETELTYSTIFIQAVATSIDALAVGISFSVTGVAILPAATVICITTFLCCLASVMTGKGIRKFLGDKAELLGGIILILLSLQALF